MKERVKEYLLNNDDTFMDVVSALDNWNGSMENIRYYENDEDFLETCFSKMDDLARAINYGNYNYMHDYIRFNAYGNLETATEYDMLAEYKDNIDYIIDELIENYINIDFEDNDLLEILKEYDEN